MIVSNTLPKSAVEETALGFIQERYRPEIGWSDFPTNRSGESTSWVTSFVLEQVGLKLPSQLRSNAVDLLLRQRNPRGSWGFSAVTPADCDSTLHAISAIVRCEAKVDIRESIAYVLQHQLPDGGFSTYNEADVQELRRYRSDTQLTDYLGWMQSHTCVTSAALKLFAQLQEMIPRKVLEMALAYVIDHQEPGGYWLSYWWHTIYFSTSRIIQSLAEQRDKTLRLVRDRATEFLLASANQEGFWDNGYDKGQPCLLSTASCLKALTSVNRGDSLRIAATEFLSKMQSPDGSWQGRPSLRIPSPHEMNPAVAQNLRIGGRGVGSLCSDERRVYTTAAVLSALDANCR